MGYSVTHDRSLEAANDTHAGESIQVRIAWADRYAAMDDGEEIRLVNSAGAVTRVERVSRDEFAVHRDDA